MTRREQILRKYWSDLNVTVVQIGKMIGGISESNVRRQAQSLGLPSRGKMRAENEKKFLPPEQVLRDVSAANDGKAKKDLKKLYQAALKKIETLAQEIHVHQKTKDIQMFAIPTAPSGSGSHATAVVLCSDWHWGENVTLEQTNGLNEFNPSNREKRALAFFSNVVRLVNIFQKDIAINSMVLALLGDFISNNIHEELQESNNDLPIDEIISVQAVLASGIQYILDNTTLDLVITTATGNHGRTTKKTHFSTEAGNSLEYLMYHNLANHFRGNKRVTFML